MNDLLWSDVIILKGFCKEKSVLNPFSHVCFESVKSVKALAFENLYFFFHI